MIDDPADIPEQTRWWSRFNDATAFWRAPVIAGVVTGVGAQGYRISTVLAPSYRRKPVSNGLNRHFRCGNAASDSVWTPAFAGVTPL